MSIFCYGVDHIFIHSVIMLNNPISVLSPGVCPVRRFSFVFSVYFERLPLYECSVTHYCESV